VALKRNNIELDLSRILSPERIFILSFGGVILAGAITLYLPLSSTKGLSFVDALFTAASAVCVTGLVVIDIGQDLTFTGQILILFLRFSQDFPG
jgi:trk system potassium uptake protein TrkH